MKRNHNSSTRWMTGAVVSLGAMALSTTAQAQTDPCKMQDRQPLVVAPIGEAPNYFTKITPDGKYMCYITSRGNFMLDLKNPSTRLHLTGDYDPVPTPPDASGQYRITIPYDGLQFFDSKPLTSKMQPGKEVDVSSVQNVYRDQQNDENYQSVGVLTKTETKTVYRVLTGGLNVVDYDTSAKPWKVLRRLNDVCQGAQKLRLPMLSKDGKMLSTYDSRTGTTKIFEIRDDGTCSELVDLGMPTGKVEFSYDNRKIVFHVDSYSRKTDGEQFQVPDSRMTKNVYVLEIPRSADKKSIVPGKLVKLTSKTAKGQATYNPSFTTDGKVAYVQAEPDGRGGSKYAFELIDPKQGRTSNVLAPGSACTAPGAATELAAIYALGSVWSAACPRLGSGLTATDAAMWTMSLDPQSCLKMVEDQWNSGQIFTPERVQAITRTGRVTEAQLKALSVDALKAVCPKAGTAPSPGPVTVASSTPSGGQNPTNQTGGTPQRTAKQIFSSKCMSCHGSGQAPRFDWERLTLDQVNNMLIAIESGSMPKETSHSFDRYRELGPLIDELKKRRTKLEEQSQ